MQQRLATRMIRNLGNTCIRLFIQASDFTQKKNVSFPIRVAETAISSNQKNKGFRILGCGILY